MKRSIALRSPSMALGQTALWTTSIRRSSNCRHCSASWRVSLLISVKIAFTSLAIVPMEIPVFWAISR